MKVYPRESLLAAGDTFDLIPHTQGDASVDAPSYFVRGFNDGAMSVAEIGGENRDGLGVLSRDIPTPDQIKKWKTRVEVAGRVPDYVNGVIAQLRRQYANIRFLDALGSYTQLCIPSAQVNEDGVSYFNATGTDFFNQAQFVLLRDGKVSPSMRLFDLGAMGVIPQECITRDESGRATSMNFHSDSLVTSNQIASVARFAQDHNLLMYPESYKNCRVFSTNLYEGIDRIEAFLRDDDGKARIFDTAQAAHAAIMDFKNSLRK